jgi:hypothetical protein
MKYLRLQFPVLSPGSILSSGPARLAMIAVAASSAIAAAQDVPPPEDSSAPAPVQEADYAELKANSPFTRSLNLSDSLILTGIARVDGETIATLVDRSTKESYVVSGAANAQGWKMVGVEGDATDLEKVTARISVAGGEVVSVRFDEKQLKPGEAKPAAGPAGGPPGPGDGERRPGEGYRGPPPEVREKMERLTEEQRQKLFQKIGELRQKNPDMSREEMREQFGKLLDRALQDRDRERK